MLIWKYAYFEIYNQEILLSIIYCCNLNLKNWSKVHILKGLILSSVLWKICGNTTSWEVLDHCRCSLEETMEPWSLLSFHVPVMRQKLWHTTWFQYGEFLLLTTSKSMGSTQLGTKTSKLLVKVNFSLYELIISVSLLH
jgi:hypothetical protein